MRIFLRILFFGNFAYLIFACSENGDLMICDNSCKTCQRPCDPNACTSCHPGHYKRSLEYWDTVFQCSEDCPQPYSLPPMKGQRFRYCNISKILNIKELKTAINIDDVVKVDKMSSNSEFTDESSSILIFFISGAILLCILLTVILFVIFKYLKKSSMPRHNSSTEELLRKDSEAATGNSQKSEANTEYLYIAGPTPNFSQLIIITNINEISIEEQCDGGHFSKVHKGKFRKKDVAIKVAEANGRQSIHTELKIYDKISHANILPAFAVYFGVKNMLLMPFRNCNLAQFFVANGSNISVTQLLQYSIQIADAMTYLHSLKIIHCDLKIDNLLMKNSSGKIIEISDFGCAVDLTDDPSPYFQGSTTHAAYEILKMCILLESNQAISNPAQAFCTKKTDVWSFAITIWQIYQKSSKIPSNFHLPKDIVKNYESGKKLEQPLLMPDYIWRYIILRCIDLEPKTRPRMSQILESLNIYQQKNCIPHEVI